MLDGCVPWPGELAARYREAGYWRGETLGSVLRTWARAYGDREALVAGAGSHGPGRRVTYRQLDAWCDRLAAGFATHGIQPRDRVVVQLPNTPEFVAVCFALFRLGALPDRVKPVGPLPLTGLGKVDKKALAARVATRATAQARAEYVRDSTHA